MDNWWAFAIYLQSNLHQRPPLYNGHFFLADSPYIRLLFQPLYNGHLSTMATFFSPQGGRFREVQMYFWVQWSFKKFDLVNFYVKLEDLDFFDRSPLRRFSLIFAQPF